MRRISPTSLWFVALALHILLVEILGVLEPLTRKFFLDSIKLLDQSSHAGDCTDRIHYSKHSRSRSVL